MSTLRCCPGEKDNVQAINALKKGSYLLKYGRWGKPKFCPFRLSDDETTLTWYAGKERKQLHLSQVSSIIPGQHTAIFQRHPQPEKEYQSFSLIYGKNSLDVICKDKCEAEVWFGALRGLISRCNCQNWSTDIRTDGTLSDSSSDRTERNSQSIRSNNSSNAIYENHQVVDVSVEGGPHRTLGRAFSDIVLYKASSLRSPQRDSLSAGILQSNENASARTSADTIQFGFSGGLSTSSIESSPRDISLSNIFMWGEGIEEGLLDGAMAGVGEFFPIKDALFPKGEAFSWGDGSGGKLGHGLEADIANPKFIDALNGLNIVSIGCGEYHTCAVTVTGELYTWGDGTANFGLLGHGNEFSYLTPRKVRGPMEGICVISISCGPFHSAAITSLGQLFTFGDGTFGALGHGDRQSKSVPTEVEALKRHKTVRVSCGFWHTAAIVKVHSESPSYSDPLTGKLFTWGSGDGGQLGHGDKLSELAPFHVATTNDKNFCQVACGHSITVALTICGQVYTMGTTDCGELPTCPGKSCTLPTRIEGEPKDSFVKEISCGSHHVVAVTSKSEVFTWGKGRNGQLGHGDNADRNSPTPVKALEGKQVKRVICGNNFTAAICLHQRVGAADYSTCAGCRSPFCFTRKRHNCYNCGLVFCKSCTNKKSLNASLAPNRSKLYRVCEDCFSKLNKGLVSRVKSLPPKDLSKEKKKESFKDHQIHVVSRISSLDSFRSSNKKNRKLDSCSSHISSLYGEKFGFYGSYTPSSSTSILDSYERTNASLKGSRIHCPSRSFSTKSTTHSMVPPTCGTIPYHEEVIDDSKLTNDELTEEISCLKEQVEILTRKSEVLAAELERASKQLNEANACVQDESEKNNAAEEAIKCLMSQLKDMAASVPQGSPCRALGPFVDNTYHVLKTATG